MPRGRRRGSRRRNARQDPGDTYAHEPYVPQPRDGAGRSSPSSPPPEPPRRTRRSVRRRNAERRAAEREAATARRQWQRREAARDGRPLRRVLTHNATIAAIAIAVLLVVVTKIEMGKSEPPPVAAANLDLSTGDMMTLLNRSDMDSVAADAVASAKKRAHDEQVKTDKAAKAKAKKDAEVRQRAQASASARALAKGNPTAGQNKAYGRQMNALKGWGRCWGSLSTLWDHESDWNERAVNPSSGAYGIPQALPGSKLASAGSDWRTSAPTQIAWGLGYIKARYGDPCKAWGFWQANNWY